MSRAQLTSTVEQNTGGAVSPFAAGKNFVVNGGMDILQRNTTITNAGASGVFLTDRWQVYCNTATGRTWSRQATSDTTNLPNIQYCVRLSRNSGDTQSGSSNSLRIWQNFETVTSIPLAGQTVTLSFYARAGSGATVSSINSVIRVGTGTDQNGFYSGYTGQTDIATTTTAITATWKRYSVTVAVPSSTTELGVFFEYVPTGTAPANDYIEFTGVQLEIGSVATPFAKASGTLQGELALCQRYFWQISSANIDRVAAQAISSTRAFGPLPLPVTMRTAPSYSFAAASNFGLINSSGGVLTCTTVSIAAQATNMVTLDFTSSGGGLTAGNATACWFQSTSSTIALSAEL